MVAKTPALWDASGKPIPAELAELLEQLTTELPRRLRGNLAAIYLYGSLTQRAFNPQRSDVDLLMVMQRRLTDAQLARLGHWLEELRQLNPWTERLQMSLLIGSRLLQEDSDAVNYHFGKLKRNGSDGNPIVWVNALESGIPLYGPPAAEMVDPISRELLDAAQHRELQYLREELIERTDSRWRNVGYYRAYAALTCCRILYSWHTGKVVSKPIAAAWASRRLPEHAELIQIALHHEGSNDRRGLALRPIRRLLSAVGRELKAPRRPR